MALMFALLITAGAALVRTIPRQSEEMDVNCTTTQAKQIMMYSSQLATCAATYGCIEGDEQNRRRLKDDQDMEFSPVERYGCYCSNCLEYMQRVQAACTACSAVNYCNMECDDDGNCACRDDDQNRRRLKDDEEGGFFAQYCMVDQMVVLPYSDSFCNMMQSTDSTCLQEMEYMVRPPQEEEDDDNNNGRRRLGNNNNNNDEEEEPLIDAAQIASCWSAPFTGGFSNENFVSMDYCQQVCSLYNDQSMDYMTADTPSQTCGMSIRYAVDGAEVSDIVPHSIQHQGILCMSSNCGEQDMGYMVEYLTGMAAYSRFIRFPEIEGQDNNNNRNDENAEGLVEPRFRVPDTVGSWRCDGSGADGAIENEDFPDECPAVDSESEEDNSNKTESTGDGQWATAATIAVICGIGMGIFACLFVYYYRQVAMLKEGGAQSQPMMSNQGAAGGTNKEVQYCDYQRSQ